MRDRDGIRGARIMTLLPMACDGVGPSETCLRIMDGAFAAGHPAQVFANRRRQRPAAVPLHLACPDILSWLPYGRLAYALSRRTEAAFLSQIRQGDIAYLWPSASVEVHSVLRQRGVPVVLEGINTRMASAKSILDAAYDAFGAPPAHGITLERIAEEEEKLRYATAIFAPSPAVAEALRESALEGATLATSYGVDTSIVPEATQQRACKTITVMFCGYACIRKGIQYLLEAWPLIRGPNLRLKIVGQIEPVIARRFAGILSDASVECTGFVRNPHAEFARANIFVMPSLEEGGPQVTYEAALHGLPIIATPMGAGRMIDHSDAVQAVPAATSAIATALDALIGDAEQRAARGNAARRASLLYDWNLVGVRRMGLIQTFFDTRRTPVRDAAGTAQPEALPLGRPQGMLAGPESPA